MDVQQFTDLKMDERFGVKRIHFHIKGNKFLLIRHRDFLNIVHVDTKKNVCPVCGGNTRDDMLCQPLDERAQDLLEELRRHPSIRLQMLFEKGL